VVVCRLSTWDGLWAGVPRDRDHGAVTVREQECHGYRADRSLKRASAGLLFPGSLAAVDLGQPGAEVAGEAWDWG
jgi:hypothetical protein